MHCELFVLRLFKISWLKEVLLDFFQFYTAKEEDELSVDEEVSRDSMTQRNDNSNTTRDELLRQLSRCEGTPLSILFPFSYVSREKDELSSDEEDMGSVGRNLQLVKCPPFDEVVR